MPALQPVRGTHDILSDDFRLHRWVGDVAAGIAARYGFEEMTPPVFEFTNVFARTLGETSDVVTKEMYTFDDRSGDSITLRPEFTAGIARAFMSNGLTQQVPVKTFSRGPVFRHERPQKGRLRQFHQIDVEILGVAQPQADIEVVAAGAHILQELGVADRVELQINSLGDPESRQRYRDVLLDYLQAHQADLSEESRQRMNKNPMRIFDSKDDGDKAIMTDAPLLRDHLNEEAQAFFATVLAGLDALGIDYTLNPKLVRGLDYYTLTAFEFVTDTLGAQGAVLAGGRYDGLMEMMGGKATPGIGWAAGVERLAMMVGDGPAATRPIVIIPAGPAGEAAALGLTQSLRQSGYRVDLGYSGNMGKRMKRANKLHARVCIILGEDEMSRGAATVRDMDTGEQTEVVLDNMIEHLSPYR